MPSDVLPLQRRSTRTRRTLFTLDTRARRLLSLAAFCLTIWLIYVSTIRSSSFKHDTRWAIIATPDDAEAPFILIDVRSDDLAIPVPLDDPQGLLSPSRFSPTHIATSPQDDGVFYIANEVTNGSIVAMELREDGSGRRWRGGTSDNRTARARVRQIVPSGGSEPCHLLASRDGRWLIAANYGSPSISLHRLPDLADSHILNLPLIDTGDSDRILSHPHQIIQHPSLSNTFFVTDLGQNLVHTVAVKNGRLVHRGIWKAHEQDVRGIRHGAFDAKNANIFFSYQNSASVLAVSLDDLGDIGKPVGPAVTTIPIALQNEPNVTLDVGDIKVLPSSIIIAANRRIAPPFAHIDAIGLAEEIGDGDRSLGGDTLVLMRHDPHGMAVQGHVELGCYQPRELLPLVQRTATYGGAREDEVLVSCHGANGRYGGARLVSVNQIPGVGPVAQVRRAWSAETAYMGMAWVV